ncbi:Signal transduction histidine kinase [Halovenus aranensis]|uniref:Signal transduction histidine kinase n=1 Tax=Halovenus aranensis TaxID=890420 RepID=A0A1G8U6C6_9EURY|nr:HAMP domain-containing sensor histidine kinase [Halovenus aranensis]SDJ49338.1 Signal transduction histidine kinase [Halovenus aranensis]
MGQEDTAGRPDTEEKTIKTAGQIVKYSREIYNLDSVEEVAMITLEAVPHVIEGYPSPAVVEIRGDGLRVLESMIAGVDTGDDPGVLTERAYEDEQLMLCAGEDVEVAYDSEAMTRLTPAEAGSHDGSVTLAAPTVYSDEVGDSGAVLLVQWDGLETVQKHHVKPVDYLAEHVATAIVNIRSRERLERARNDLAKRKEMIEVYERLLRHDLGNDLQVITGFSDALVDILDEGDQAQEYADKIFSTSNSAAELIDTVGETVRTIREQGQAEPREIRPILTEVVDDVETKYGSLSVEYDSDAFEYRAYAGDLIDSVFTNILSNAAVHNTGPVTVRLYAEEPTPDTVVIGIADDGTGIATGMVEDIFEMGKKGPDSDGTGFGLGLAKTLVESYGGSITVTESDRGGADFRITLDLA